MRLLLGPIRRFGSLVYNFRHIVKISKSISTYCAPTVILNLTLFSVSLSISRLMSTVVAGLLKASTYALSDTDAGLTS